MLLDHIPFEAEMPVPYSLELAHFIHSPEFGAFCDKNYGISFPLFAKVEVKGAGAHQLFQYLTQAKPGILGTEAIKWNFTKFLVDRDGDPVARYAPQVPPADLEKPIEKLLSS